MEEQDRPVEPLLEPAEGTRPEQQEEYEQGERELSRVPLQEPAEGGRDQA